MLLSSFTWIATGSSVNVSGFSSGSGSSINQILVNSGLTIETVTYHIVPTANGCVGDAADFVVTVHPLPIPYCRISIGLSEFHYSLWYLFRDVGLYMDGFTRWYDCIRSRHTQHQCKLDRHRSVQTISVNYTDAFGCTAASLRCLMSMSVCCRYRAWSGQTTHASGVQSLIQPIPGMASYSWVISGGGTGTAGGGPTNPSVTVLWTITAGQTVSVNCLAGPSCTAPNPTVLDVSVNPLPTATIAGTITVCQNSASPLITFTGASSTAPYTLPITSTGCQIRQ